MLDPACSPHERIVAEYADDMMSRIPFMARKVQHFVGGQRDSGIDGDAASVIADISRERGPRRIGDVLDIDALVGRQCDVAKRGGSALGERTREDGGQTIGRDDEAALKFSDAPREIAAAGHEAIKCGARRLYGLR